MKMLRRSVCLQSAAALVFFSACALLSANAQNGPAPATPAAQPVNTPNWPVNEAPKPAVVQWDSHGLSIQAQNSSLKEILNEIAEKTGAKLEGLVLEGGMDQRVFGEYGPGAADSVLAQLLNGSGYNVMLIGDQGQGTPQEIVLSQRSAPGSQPVQPVQNSEDEDEEQDQPAYQPSVEQSPINRFRRMQEMRQQEQQQPQQPPQQPQNNPQQF
jgi:hypothetical protein